MVLVNVPLKNNLETSDVEHGTGTTEDVLPALKTLSLITWACVLLSQTNAELSIDQEPVSLAMRATT
jgi:hypothetical protein